jgi:outer membrane receptor for ferric coprogen and ferric-rhodotorulic acid
MSRRHPSVPSLRAPRFSLHPLALASALLLAQSAPARAADTVPEAQSQPDATLQTVTVTGAADKQSYTVRDTDSATRFDLSPLETPQSVSVVTRAKIDDFKLNTVNDMLASVPGVTVESVESDRTYYTARGFDITNFQYDGVGVPFVFGNVTGDFDTALYDQVDVVRGANGLTTSTGNPSATVNFVRKRPGDKLAVSAGVTIGAWGNKRVDVDASVPLGDGWAARVVLARDQGNSYLDRYALRKTVASVIVEGKLDADDKVAAGYSYQKSASTGTMWGALPLYYTDGSPTTYPRSANTAANWSYENAAINSTFAEWTHQFGNGWSSKATITVNTSPIESDLFYVSGIQDKDTGLGLTSYPSYFKSNFRQTLGDVSVSGKFDLGGRRHDLSFGASWSQSKIHEYSVDGEGIGTDLPGNSAVDGSYPEPVFDNGTTTANYTDQRKNAFVAARWNLADDWKLLTGANTVKVTTQGDNFGVSSYRDATKTTPYAGLVYDITRTLAAYGTYTAIFNPQNEIDINRQTLAPIEGKTYELGLKSELFGGKANLSGAIFKTRQTNAAQQEGYIGVDAYYIGVDAESKGVELELTGELAKNWQASIGYSAMSMQGDDGGDVRTFIPRKTLRSSTTYRFASLPALKVGASLNWQSPIYLDDVVAVIHQGAYASVGLMAQYEINPHVKLSANLNNVTNKTHLESLYWDQSYYAAPRNGSVSLNWTY